jgi:hypothetical protein
LDVLITTKWGSPTPTTITKEYQPRNSPNHTSHLFFTINMAGTNYESENHNHKYYSAVCDDPVPNSQPNSKVRLESLLPENEKNLTQELEQHQLKPKNKRLPRIQGAQQQLRKLHKPKTSKTVRPPNQLMLHDIPGFTKKTETISQTSCGHEPEPIDENATF